MKVNIFNIKKNLKKEFRIVAIYLLVIQLCGCSNFLDVAPDNIANIDNVFANQKEAERYLATLYSYAPEVHHDSRRSLIFLGGDDIWTYSNNDHYDKCQGVRISRGEQNINTPYENYWDGESKDGNAVNNKQINMFRAIRDCNTFIEEMSKQERVPELSSATRMRWIAEANFLKAYYHFLLFRMYGPIPIIDNNLSVGTDVEGVTVKRDPLDKVVNYISGLLDKAADGLPQVIENTSEEAGRVTKAAAYMLKAKLWITAASPLFNGNSDYKGYVDKDNVILFPQEYNAAKWDSVIVACEKAMNNIPGIELYKFQEVTDLHKPTQLQMNLRGAITDRFNKELIWGRYMNDYQNIVLQAEASVPQMIDGTKNNFQSSCFSVTFNMVERFYTKNGVPIEEDITWPYTERYVLSTTDEEQKYNLIVGYPTAKLNQDRESRFYASLMFDGSVVYMKNTPIEEKAHQIKALYKDRCGISNAPTRPNVTGYWIKKLINWEYSHSQSGATTRWYPWPEMRLADLKLLYAEALNEVGRSKEAIEQIDDIRERAGLEGVKESWKKYSIYPTKPDTKEGLRKIIHQEREIELAFEGHRLWDLKRWKEASDFLNKDVKGWNVYGETPQEYYQINKVYEQKFVAPRDYLWPLSLAATLRNANLIQNPGW